MTDAVGAALRAAAFGSPAAYPLVFVAGVATSIGPCVAPRYIAVAALANASGRPWRIVGSFVAGLVGAYVVLGLAASALGALWSTSRPVYLGLAAVLAAAGLAALLRDERRGDERAHAGRVPAGVGGTFLLGASSALVVSPCCTPVVAGIAGLTTLGGRTFDGAALLAAFALGHAAPLLAAGAVGTRIAALLGRLTASSAPSVVAGTLLLALAAYYGVLA